VVTLTDGEWYTAKSVDDDTTGMKLFASLMVMIRANNASRVKGERVAAAWSRKRKEARETSKVLSDRMPGWFTPGTRHSRAANIHTERQTDRNRSEDLRRDRAGLRS
jgi:hypothetical protein